MGREAGGHGVGRRAAAAGGLAARVQAAHEDAAARLEPPAEGPLEYALRVARYRTLAAAQAIHDALVAAEQELAPLGRVRR